jgi:hypothetical protein
MKRHKTLMAAAVGTAPIMRPAWSWAPAPAEPNKYEWGQHMPYMMWDGSWYAMIFGPLFMILGLAGSCVGSTAHGMGRSRGTQAAPSTSIP